MSLFQRYIFRQVLVPLVAALLALSLLALLTQSLSTLELVVQNRQSAGTFLWITILALPQLLSIILPLAVLLAVLFALNRLNGDSELVVARATGVTPWQIADPVLRVAIIAAVLQLLVNLFVQPAAFREMRQSLLDVRTDIASRMVRAGEFTSPTDGLTIYGQKILPDGSIENLLIHDARQEGRPTTYVAEQGRVAKSDITARLTLYRGNIQTRVGESQLDFIEFDTHQIDMSDVVAEDTVLRLKKSDRYLHELWRPNFADMQRSDEFLAEAHARLSAPLYVPALALLAVVFLAVGKHSRMGYGRSLVLCAVLGFGIRLAGFSLTAAAESNAALNALQYGLPFVLGMFCLGVVAWRPEVVEA